MLSRVMVLSVLLLWGGFVGLGYAGNDDLNRSLVPSLFALDNQDSCDDRISHRSCDFTTLSALSQANFLDFPLDQRPGNGLKIRQEDYWSYQRKCALLL
jgi:hypothetical protein